MKTLIEPKRLFFNSIGLQTKENSNCLSLPKNDVSLAGGIMGRRRSHAEVLYFQLHNTSDKNKFFLDEKLDNNFIF